MLTEFSFFICALVAIVLSVFMITRTHPVTAAMLLVVIMMLLAGMYGLLGAHFSAVAQIIVYAGAIMVVFVFVIMILNLPSKSFGYGRITIGEILLIGLGVLTAIFLGTKASFGYLSKLFAANSSLTLSLQNSATQTNFAETENVKNVSALMFTNYLWPFELISFLILVSILGAVIVAKKETNRIRCQAVG